MIDILEQFIREKCYDRMLEAVRKGKTSDTKSITVDYNELDKFDPQAAEILLDAPNRFFYDLEEAIKEIDFGIENVPEITVRFSNVPDDRKIKIKDLRSEHIGKFVKVEGLVKRASTVIPEINVAIFECPDCAEKHEIFQLEKTMTYPAECSCGKKKGFKLLDRKLHDTRYIYLDDPFENVGGEEPGRITTFLKDDLTTPEMQRKTDPGSRLEITGVIKELPKKIGNQKSRQLEMFLECNHFQATEVEFEDLIITPEDEIEIRKLAADPHVYDKLRRSVAPSMFGLDEIKDAILLQLFGGVPQTLPDGTRIRGDIHVLLMGDPSAGKTQLLKLVSKIVPRGRYVSGKGTSAAGLTATVVKDEEFMGGWVLEAGAIVLSNKSTICIDEFDKMSKEDMINLHEAMSTQTVSIAKASVQATLPARTSILAGANPKLSRFDPMLSLPDQINLPDTILSRFDLKFLLYDRPNKEHDEKLVDHVIKARMNRDEITPELSPDFIRKFVAFCKQESKPEMTREAALMFKEFFINMRNKFTGKNAIPITLRQYEGLMRLSEASAKIRLSERVDKSDAERAIKLMTHTINQLGYDPLTGEIDIDRLEGSMPASQRNKIIIINETINQLQQENGGEPFSVVDLYAALEEQGIDENVAKPIITKMKDSGEIFEPIPGKFQKV